MKISTVGVACLLLVLSAFNPTDAWIHNWHTGPINCYTCDNYEECAAGTGVLRKCLDNDSQSCVAIFASNGTVVQRGCSDNLEEICSESSDNCYECRSHGCNDLADNTELISCVVCDAQSDDNCVFDIELVKERRQCQKQCITALYPRSSEPGSPKELTRSCRDDLDHDDREACSDGTLADCVACSGDNCNTVDLGVRSSCNQCSGGNCANPQASTCRAVPAEGTDEECYIEVDESGAVYELGCISQFNVSEAVLLETEKRIWTCSGANNCNLISALPTPKNCKLCSSRTDTDCAIDPESVESETLCQNPVNTHCYSRLLETGHTERGCMADLGGDDYIECLNGGNSTKCSSCSGDNCNEELHPIERLSCHVCSSNEDENCEAKPTSSSICLLHTGDQQCLTTIDPEGKTQRGCSASLACSSTNPQNCQACSGSNCNTDNLKRRSDGIPGQWDQELPISCQSCNDTTECAATNLEAIACPSSLEYCVTVFDSAGLVTARGCSNTVESSWSTYCDDNSKNCHNCNSNGCNSATSLSSYTECIYCDADNANCESNPSAVVTRRLCNGQCMTALRPKSNGSLFFDPVRNCLDDKSAEDQLKCINGEDKLCSACSGEACNVAVLPEDRLSCYHCSGDGCESDFVSQTCANYQAEDHCYILYEATQGDIVQMGCQSSETETFIDDNFSQLFLCSEDNCNNFANQPQAQTCISCDSGDDENCAIDATKIISSPVTCSQLPHTSCMTRVLTTGVTQRGCVNQLSNALLKSCVNGEGNCEVCQGDLCNREVYPENRRRCQRCNTVDDPTCLSSPNASSVCPFYLDGQGCSVKLVDGETYRGCEKDFACDDSDKQHCRACSSKDNCNVADLSSSNIGYPGKWVTPPINCYHCEGSTCENSNLGPLQKCTGNDEQNCVTVFASNGTVQLRSCTDELYENDELLQYCDDEPGNCKYCKSTGCNTADSLDNYQDCLFCDSTDQAECVRNVASITKTVSCQGSCFTGLYSSNRSDSNAVLHVERGCLDFIEYDDRLACEAGTLENCKACSSAEKCNTDDVPESRLSCNFCEDADCSTTTSQLCLGYRANDQCYIHVGDLAVLNMGCVSDVQDEYITSNRRDIYLCSENNCNTKDVLNTVGVDCAICNSTADVNCVTGNDVPTVTCQHYLYPQCYSQLSQDGVLTRGCIRYAEDDLFYDCISGNSTSCEICDSNSCNTGVYPSDWRSCLRCDSNKDEDCAKNPSSYSNYCPIYDSEDACVTSLEKTRTRRGCRSELNCDASEAGTCRICSEENCNDVDLVAHYVGEPGKWQDLPLSCLVCEGSANCDPASAVSATCEGNNKQTCSTVFGTDGLVLARGCSDSIHDAHSDICDADSENCQQCKSNDCNSAISLDSYVDCYFCDAADDAKCAWEVPTSTRKCQGQCMTGLYPRSSSPDSALLPTRSCLTDLNKADRDSCAAGTHANCTACTGTLCNGGDIIEDPLSCYTCATDDCEDIISVLCLAFQINDSCYTAFDAYSSVIALGCRSEFEREVFEELLAQKRMLLCEGNNCNDFDLPTPNTCIKCNSQEDLRCATNPNQILTTVTCSDLPYTECVSHIDDEGHTSRDCVSNLETDDFYAWVTGTANHTETCTGDQCNGLTVYPVGRRSCHQCNSQSDENCASSPSSSAVCPIFVENDSCVTTQINGITHRGCSSIVTCPDPDDTRTCRICNSADGCNTIDLERINQDGSPGIWQEVPISCLACNDVASCASSGGTLETCVGYGNCITVFDESGVVNQRGCSDKVYEESTYCEEQPDQCPRCNSNGCNTANSLDSYVECFVCDSSKNRECVTNPSAITTTRQCNERCVTVFLNLFNETSDPSYAVIRDCGDNLEEGDRDSCEAGGKENCAICKEAKCNTEDLVASRKSCYICEGDECQLPQTYSCPNYRQNDKCYVEFDEKRSIVKMGCTSEKSAYDLQILQEEKRLYTCDEDDCNSIEDLPEAQTCVLCSSRTDYNCALAPNTVTSSTVCSLLGLPQCYTRVLPGGYTERGCVSNLENNEFLSCYNGTSSSCSSCQGDLCNNAVYPENRRSCHVCNSGTDASCESTPDSLAVCYLYEADDQCVTNLRNDITYRGCKSSISCEANSKTCVYCEGDGCNLIDLAAKADDNYGKWQDLPLSCLTCEGTDCQGDDISSEKCQSNNEQDCVTVFDASGVVTRRGCEDEVDQVESLATYCAANPASCPACKSNNCNNATQLSQYTTCINCDSFSNPNCLWEPTSTSHRSRQCQGGCMTALYGSSELGRDLIRTCLDDKEVADRLTCEAGTDSTCSACTGDSCNVEVLPADRISCYTCDGDDCEDPVSRPCSVYKPNDFCFLWFDDNNSIQKADCGGIFRNQELEDIIKTKRISVCEGSNCNVPQLQSAVSCAVCDSKVDPTCATNAQEVSTFTTCSQLPHTHCVTRLESDNSTTRGCLYDLSQNDFAACLLGNDSNCDICNENGCNRKVFPADRQVCYTCTSEDDVYCESNPSYSLACPWISDTETCKTSLVNNVTIRGCSSSVDCDTSDYRNCRSCAGSECNAIDLANRVDDGQHGLFQPLPLKCYSCAGADCYSSLGPFSECTLNIEQDCKTVFEADGVTVRRRGCSDDVDDYEDRYCRENPDRCFTCKSNECNSAWSIDEYVSCVYCDSRTNVNCVSNPESTSRQCNGKCLVSLFGTGLIRTCEDDLDELDRSDCSSDQSGQKCATCSNQGCNNFVYPSDRLSCHVCTNSACTSSSAQYCQAYESSDYCFAKYQNGALELIGCASAQNSSDLDSWKEQNLLYTCTDKDCNELNRLPNNDECIACDSRKTLECAQEPTAVSTTETCHAPLSDCVTRLQDGHTIRSCLNYLSSEEGSSCVANGTCSSCAGSKCNVEIFPAGRRSCHICNSVANPECAKDPNNLAICPIYAVNDRCVSTYGDDGYLQRGCESEVQCVNDNDDYCQICDTDGCNTKELTGAAGPLASFGFALTLFMAWLVSQLRV
ncbi:G surface protein, allelic form 168 [Drosophila tropicalis]|uniref:G surface protein, allelic form 168 n=1 Tax=Drosophila tropicalis TaxID=46794 RepID=UPI0035AB6C29